MTRLVCRVAVTDVHKTRQASSELVTQARLGDTAVVQSRRAGWFHLKFDHDGYGGWARSISFAPAGRPIPKPNLRLVSSLFANIHAGPSVRTPLLLTAPLGSPLGLLGPARTDGGGAPWARVRAPGGLRGFALAGDLSRPSAWPRWPAPALRRSLVRQALKLLGLPYRWGGTTTYGFDCSGFVQCLYRLHGISLPRDAWQQAASPLGRPVSRSSLRAGDLLFFAWPKNRRISHVGLAISHREFIHATTSGSPGVQVGWISGSQWKVRLAGQRRLA